jgi:hypothetical protein
MSVRITCITKSDGNHENAYTAIQTLGWIEDGTNKTGKSTRLEIYNWIKDKKGIAYVKDSKGNAANLICAETDKGTKYVKTKADDVKSDNLLQLEECK